TAVVNRLSLVGAFFVVFIPASFSLVLALESFVGERERTTLAVLLSTPLREAEIYAGKVVAVLAVALTLCYGGLSGYCLVAFPAPGLAAPDPDAAGGAGFSDRRPGRLPRGIDRRRPGGRRTPGPLEPGEVCGVGRRVRRGNRDLCPQRPRAHLRRCTRDPDRGSERVSAHVCARLPPRLRRRPQLLDGCADGDSAQRFGGDPRRDHRRRSGHPGGSDHHPHGRERWLERPRAEGACRLRARAALAGAGAGRGGGARSLARMTEHSRPQ